MPVSVWLGLEDSMQTVVDCRARSVLDAGIGFGLFGHLLRQYLDVWEGHIQRTDWHIRIDGIEIDERRVQPHSRYLYNEVFIGDIRDLVPQCAARFPYDVIIFGDVLEHLPKSDAGLLMRQAIAHARKIVLIRIPLGDGWRKKGRDEPDHHRSIWSTADFTQCTCTIRQYDYFGNPYALIAIDAPTTRALMLEQADYRLLRIEERIRKLSDSTDLSPASKGHDDHGSTFSSDKKFLRVP